MPIVKSELLRHSIQQVSEAKQFGALAFCDRQQIDSKTSITFLTCTLFYKQNVRACFVANTMQTVNKNTFHRVYLFIYYKTTISK